jgi:hypothetical protein
MKPCLLTVMVVHDCTQALRTPGGLHPDLIVVSHEPTADRGFAYPARSYVQGGDAEPRRMFVLCTVTRVEDLRRLGRGAACHARTFAERQ